MIVGCYSLHLYCDHKNITEHPYRYLPHEYTGETGAECRNYARKDGWIINLRENTAICPLCSKKKVTK